MELLESRFDSMDGMRENFIIDLIEKDPWRMEVLQVVKELNLPDWLVGAGFIRNPVLDKLHGFA